MLSVLIAKYYDDLMLRCQTLYVSSPEGDVRNVLYINTLLEKMHSLEYLLESTTEAELGTRRSCRTVLFNLSSLSLSDDKMDNLYWLIDYIVWLAGVLHVFVWLLNMLYRICLNITCFYWRISHVEQLCYMFCFEKKWFS